MAFTLNITAPFRVSIQASSGHLSVLFGLHERGFALESGYGPNENGKLVETWRNQYCGSLNVAVLGLRLIVSGTPSKEEVHGTA